MKVLIDTNVAITYISGRDDSFSSEIEKAWTLSLYNAVKLDACEPLKEYSCLFHAASKVHRCALQGDARTKLQGFLWEILVFAEMELALLL